MIGRTLDRYRIDGKLGEGGMGVVYSATDPQLGRAVAIKVLPPEATADASRKQRFAQEARAASALNHPGIVTVYDVASDGGTDFIVMELVTGRTLDQILAGRGLGVVRALRYSVAIADALAKAHGAGIVHRDLKPSNVMVTEDDRIKILDFGLAKLFDETDERAATQMMLTDRGSIVGTAAYMSPEQARGEKLDGQSDIFSFGSVLKPTRKSAYSQRFSTTILRRHRHSFQSPGTSSARSYGAFARIPHDAFRRRRTSK